MKSGFKPTPPDLKHEYCTLIQFCAILESAAEQLKKESVAMNRIQKWFEQIAGVTQEERQRWALAQEIFGTPRVDVLALQKPACWRRKVNRSRRSA